MERYQKEYGLSGYDSRIITESRKLSDLFEQTTALCGLPKKTANWLIGETSRLMKENAVEADQLIFSPGHLASLIKLTESGSINTTIAKEVFEKIFKEDIEPEQYVKENGLLMVNDDSILEETIEAVLAANPQTVEEYRSGKTKVISYLVGQVMKQMKGKANPGKVNEILGEKLEI